MEIRDKLEKLQEVLEGISPSVGRVYHTLRYSYEPADIITDYSFEDAILGRTLKAFIVAPGTGQERRATTGNAGWSIENQTFHLRGYVGIKKGQGDPDLVLETDFETIRDTLRDLKRLADSGDAVHVGSMDWTPIIGERVGDIQTLRKELIFVIQDRKGA